MKKLISLTLCAILSVSMFAGCEKAKDTVDDAVDDVSIAVKDIWGSIEEAIGADNLSQGVELSDQELLDMYGIKAEDLEEYYVRTPAMNVHAEEFFVAKVKEGKMEDVKAGIEKRKADLDTTWKQYLPEQYEYVKNAQVVEKGNYIMFVVSANADQAVKSFNSNFSK